MAFFHSLNIRPLILFGALMAICLTSCSAQPASAETLDELIDRLELTKMNALIEFIEQNPESEDLDEAYSLTFRLATRFSKEDSIVPLAEKYLAGDGTSAEAKANAILVNSLARKGEFKAATERFESMARFGARRDPNTVGSCGLTLADDAQLAGEPKLAKQILAAMVEHLPLLPQYEESFRMTMDKLDWVNNPAPELTVSDFEENPIKIEDYEGKILLIDFWGTFCGPCIKEFPELKKMYSEYHDQGFEIVGISLDDSQAEVEQFQKQFELPWTLSMGNTDDRETIKRYQAKMVPSTCLIGRDGKVIAVELRGDTLRKAVAAQFDN